MIYDVYILRSEGVRLDEDRARATVARGKLGFTKKRPNGMIASAATLYSDTGGVIRELNGAEVRVINDRGILLHGFDGPTPFVKLVRQAWWCEYAQAEIKKAP